MRNLRDAFRQLLKIPLFTSAAVLTLALGIGANTAIFTVLNDVLFREVPYNQPERLVLVAEGNPLRPAELTVACSGEFFDWREQSKSFADLAAVAFANFNLSGVDQPERLAAGMVSPTFFDLLGTQPLLGRTFRADDGEEGKFKVAVISYALWQRRFGGDPNVVGKTVTLNGLPHVIVGVLPASFHFEHPTGIREWPAGWGDADVWRPIPFGPADRQTRNAHWLLVVGRLKPGVPVAAAQAELQSITSRIPQDQHADLGAVSVARWRDRVAARSRGPLLLLALAAAAVLLIACANVANLLLARAASRAREFAIRVALGAGRKEIARQLFSEALLLSLAGGAGGALLAFSGVAAFVRFAPSDSARLLSVHPDWRALAFTAVVCLGTALLFGIVPLATAFRSDPAEALASGGKTASEGPRRHALRSVLVVAEIACAIVLLTLAGVLIRSFWELRRVDPGFKPDHLVALDVSLADFRYRDAAKRVEFVRRLVDEVKALPEIQSAASVYGLPFGSMTKDHYRVILVGAETRPSSREPSVGLRMASAEYFQTMRIPLLAGRDFTRSDDTNAPPVVIVNEAFTRQFVRRPIDAIGKQARVADEPKTREIIGVVGDVTAEGLGNGAGPEVYVSHYQSCEWYLSLVARSSVEAGFISERLRAVAARIDPNCPVYNVRSLPAEISRSMTPRRFTLRVLWCFAATAIALAAVGIYSVIAYSVGRRVREFQIRLALGATKRHVLALVMGCGFWMIAFGVALGVAGSLASRRVIAGELFQVQAADPLTVICVVMGVVAVGAIACWIPARRATRVNPAEALRSE